MWLVSDGPDPAATPAPAAPADELWPAGDETSYSRDDLRKQAGLDERAMTELESFGLLPAAGPEGYGPEALRVAQACAGFFAYGVEARHLKMYKRFAEQEAAILSQVAPPVGAKDPGAAAKAAEALTDLARLGSGPAAVDAPGRARADRRGDDRRVTSGTAAGPKPWMDAAELAETVARLAAEIDRDHPDGVVLIGVLKGSLFFLADLARAITVPCEVDFMAISHFAPDSGRVRIVKDLEGDISGRNVVVVEDVVDTGLTLSYLLGPAGRPAPGEPRGVRPARPVATPDRAPADPLLRRCHRRRVHARLRPRLRRAIPQSSRVSSSAIFGSWNGIRTHTCRICTGGKRLSQRYRSRRAALLGWLHDRRRQACDPSFARGRTSRGSEQPADRPAARRSSRPALPPDLHRPAGGDGDRLRPPGHGSPRPMTHDLFKNTLEEMAARIDRIVITELKDGTFYAELEIVQGTNRHKISSRPSDAIALAVRYEEPVPIFAADTVLEEAGVVFESDDEEEQVEQFREFLERVRPEDFAP